MPPATRPLAIVLLLGLALVTHMTVAVPAAAADKPLRVHFISGSREYKSEESLKAFKEFLEANYRVEVTASWGHDGIQKLEGLDALEDAELMLVFARRMKLGEEQMQLIRAHWQAGKPVVGIRTASHAFAREDNEFFDRRVLGGNYRGHYGGEEVKVTATAGAADHPVLAAVGTFTSAKLYKAGELPDDTIVLQTGDNGKAAHPVTWVHTYRGGRTFYTSLGVPRDFENADFRRLLVNAILWTTKRDPAAVKK